MNYLHKKYYIHRKMAVEINNVSMYDVSYLKDKIPTYFSGFSTNLFKVVKKKNVPDSEYIYASYLYLFVSRSSECGDGRGVGRSLLFSFTVKK